MRRGRYGVPMQVYGAILPGATAVSRLLPMAVASAQAEAGLSTNARHRLKVIRWYEEHGRNASLTCRHFSHSRSTFHAWLRRYKLEVLVRREGWEVSTSMVGRILHNLKEQGLVWEPDLRDPCIVRRPHNRPYATRKPRDYVAKAPGDLVEVDTADIRFLPGEVYKHFGARDVIGRWDVLDVHHRATGQAAASFLDVILERMPFPVRATQVDGGSEVKAEFEE